MAPPTRPVAPPQPLRSVPDEFSARAELAIQYQWTNLPTWQEAIALFCEDQAAQAAAAAAAAGAAGGFDLTGKALQFLRVNAGETGTEFDGTLSGIAALSSAGLMVRTGPGTYATRAVGASGLATSTDGDGVLGSPTIDVPAATQAEAEAGSSNTKAMTPLRARQADIAFRNSSALGWGQTLTDVTGSRDGNTSYQNTTGRPILVGIRPAVTGSGRNLQQSADNVNWVNAGLSGGAENYMQYACVPSGHYYRFTSTFIAIWTELR